MPASKQALSLVCAYYFDEYLFAWLLVSEHSTRSTCLDKKEHHG